MAKKLTEEMQKAWQELERQQAEELEKVLIRAGIKKQERVSFKMTSL